MIAEGAEAFAFGVHLVGADLARLAEADNARDIQRARAVAALLTAAFLLRDQADAGLALRM